MYRAPIRCYNPATDVTDATDATDVTDVTDVIASRSLGDRGGPCPKGQGSALINAALQ